MNHFTKAICVIDTSSIINLDAIQLANKDILYYIRRFFDVHVYTVIREELQRNRDLVSRGETSYWYSFLSSKSYSPEILIDDSSVVGPFYESPPTFVGPKDAGEHGNARISLELLITKRVGHVIFITDDKKACNAFLGTLRKSFPGITLWTSADVILYLGAILLKEKKTTFENIRAALRDFYASKKKWEDMSETERMAEREAKIKNQGRSVKSLQLIKKVIDHWRN